MIRREAPWWGRFKVAPFLVHLALLNWQVHHVAYWYSITSFPGVTIPSKGKSDNFAPICKKGQLQQDDGMKIVKSLHCRKQNFQLSWCYQNQNLANKYQYEYCLQRGKNKKTNALKAVNNNSFISLTFSKCDLSGSRATIYNISKESFCLSLNCVSAIKSLK